MAESVLRFPAGTTAGEISYLVLKAAVALVPLAPACFMKRGLDGSMVVNTDMLIDAAEGMAAMVAHRSVKLAAEDATFQEGGE